MATVPGVVSKFDEGPAAIIGGVPTKDRRLTSHFFSGPDYPVIHPGIFPHNSEAAQMATIEQWLTFDHKAGWGTEEFEEKVDDGEIEIAFPEFWADRYDREDARFILDEQFQLLEEARQNRLVLLRNGYLLGDVVADDAKRGLRFRVQVKNGTDGHNVPTGFTGERLVWLNVVVRDSEGTVIFESGDLDPNGDLRDGESSFVHNGELPLDKQLFNLQSRFVVTNVRGGERERVIPIPFSTTALPIVRPSTQSLILTGQPSTERNHRHGIEPLGERWARYLVDAEKLTGKAPYAVEVMLKAAMVPVNLIAAVQEVGFDYGMSPREVGDAVVAGHEILWTKTIALPGQ